MSKSLENGKQGGIIKQRSSSLVVYEGLKLRALQGKKYKTRVSSQVMYFLPGHTLGPLKKHFTVYTYAPLRNDL